MLALMEDRILAFLRGFYRSDPGLSSTMQTFKTHQSIYVLL